MAVIGYIASLFIGISLGLIGGGGSVLTVPVLVYLFNVEPVMATAYSLFIVGFSSLIGAGQKYFEKLVDLRTAIVFGLPSIAAVYLTRKWIVPSLPNEILSISGFTLTKPIALMLLFAVLMIAASVSMIKENENKNTEAENSEAERKFNYPMILIEGIVVGILTGLVGAGGGFLIIPALVMLSKLSMKLAVGTSLVIIAAKSLIGFAGDVQQHGSNMDWILLISVTMLAVAGIFMGNRLSNKIDGKKLKKGFGWFVLVMGILMLYKEFCKTG
ncbi:MAG: sulfite exporter TauE/SafE family protein [Bacteroidia bacterium]|nr:sulfite exporter TauE/SafE family protein [Bacteroidia bacterium]